MEHSVPAKGTPFRIAMKMRIDSGCVDGYSERISSRNRNPVRVSAFRPRNIEAVSFLAGLTFLRGVPCVLTFSTKITIHADLAPLRLRIQISL